MSKKKIKIGLVGYGRFGKKYFKNLKKSVEINLQYILKKKDQSINGVKVLTNVKKTIKYPTDGIIIATPPKTHFHLCKFFLERNKPVILEKPATSNMNQLKKLIKIKNSNLPLLVNHSDLYNPLFIELQKFKKKIGKILFIEINFGKFDYQYTLKRGLLPAEDWLPHILATLTNFLKNELTFKITHKNLIKRRNCFFQELSLDIFGSKGANIGKIFFSNLKKNRSLNVIGSNGNLHYDAYNLNNNYVKINNKVKKIENKTFISPMEYLLKTFSKHIKNKNKKNDLDVVLGYQKYFDKIKKRIN